MHSCIAWKDFPACKESSHGRLVLTIVANNADIKRSLNVNYPIKGGIKEPGLIKDQESDHSQNKHWGTRGYYRPTNWQLPEFGFCRIQCN